MITASACAELSLTPQSLAEHSGLVDSTCYSVVLASCSCVNQWSSCTELKLGFASSLWSSVQLKKLGVIPSHQHQTWTIWLQISQSEDCAGGAVCSQLIPAFCFTPLLVSALGSSSPCLWNQKVLSAAAAPAGK